MCECVSWLYKYICEHTWNKLKFKHKHDKCKHDNTTNQQASQVKQPHKSYLNTTKQQKCCCVYSLPSKEEWWMRGVEGWQVAWGCSLLYLLGCAHWTNGGVLATPPLGMVLIFGVVTCFRPSTTARHSHTSYIKLYIQNLWYQNNDMRALFCVACFALSTALFWPFFSLVRTFI